MKTMRVSTVTLVTAAALLLGGCENLRMASVVKVPSTPAECKGKSDNACSLNVAVTAIGERECKVKVAIDRIEVGPPLTRGQDRGITWTLVDAGGQPANNEFAFVDDVGVYPLLGSNPNDGQFTRPKRTAGSTFEWRRVDRATPNPTPPEVKYNVLVVRKTGNGVNQQVRLCDNVDPLIMNVD